MPAYGGIGVCFLLGALGVFFSRVALLCFLSLVS